MTRIAAALVQLLWQGAGVGLLVALAAPALRRLSSAARYAWLCLALASLPVLFVGTLACAPARLLPVLGGGVALSPLIVAAWLAGMAGCAFYGAAGWIATQRLRRGIATTVPAPWLAHLEALRARLRVGARVRLGLSAAISGPCTLGCWRPWILLPLSAVTALAPEQLQALLAHELAHIRRHDYLVNLAQRALEIVFFYHPVVWWLSRQIRQEREHCCDDIAVAACGDRAAYARVLVDLAAWHSNLALAAAGGSLCARVRRVLALPEARPRRLGAALGFAALLALALLAPRSSALPLPPLPSAPAVAVFHPPPRPLRPRPPAAVPAPGVASVPTATFAAVAFIPACGPQLQWVPRLFPDGSIGLVPRTVTRCEVLVLTTT